VETNRRSFAKALSWRVFATLITMTVAYLLTGELTFAIEIGALDTGAKLFIYFAHERVWQRISYGKIDAPDYQI
jgi:uncharacterized membrane protein